MEEDNWQEDVLRGDMVAAIKKHRINSRFDLDDAMASLEKWKSENIPLSDADIRIQIICGRIDDLVAEHGDFD